MTQRRKRYDKQLKVAAAIDARHREVVGWSMSSRITEKLAIDALNQAVGREDQPNDYSLVFHDDQGSQCAPRAFQGCPGSRGIAQSTSRSGNPWCDAAAESSFKALRREPIDGRRCESKDEARREASKCIELCCNRRRLHSKNGYMAPCDLGRDAA